MPGCFPRPEPPVNGTVVCEPDIPPRSDGTWNENDVCNLYAQKVCVTAAGQSYVSGRVWAYGKFEKNSGLYPGPVQSI